MLASAGTAVVMRAQADRGQVKPTGRPSPPDPSPDADVPGAATEKSPAKLALEANEKDIKKNIEKLFQLATDLKAEVEKTDSSQVLSLAMVKKAEEIEKLAREIKTRAKG
jgi:nucleotide-binding universal stress UspA family protein